MLNLCLSYRGCGHRTKLAVLVATSLSWFMINTEGKLKLPDLFPLYVTCL